MAWEHEIERRAGEVGLVMQAAGTVDFTRSTSFEKRIVLRDGEAMARVAYAFFVGQELMTPRKIGLWFYNKVDVVGERCVYRFRLDDGIVTVDPAMGGRRFALYTSGEASYVATLMPHENKAADWSAPVNLTFPETGYVYDVRRGRSLGRVNAAQTTVLAGEPAIYGLLLTASARSRLRRGPPRPCAAIPSCTR